MKRLKYICTCCCCVISLLATGCTPAQRRDIQDLEDGINECLQKPVELFQDCADAVCEEADRIWDENKPKKKKQAPNGGSSSMSSGEYSLEELALMDGITEQLASGDGASSSSQGGKAGIGDMTQAGSYRERACDILAFCCAHTTTCPGDAGGLCPAQGSN